ncbi:MAG: hypothetical protein EOP86_26150 [Verrucomicrobiaceae bacterium]|nr:MAG: hypothetical protein EOP86_26150 [Verrucomicrobiaceae bacterium]
MKIQFMADGRDNLLRSPEFQSRLRGLRESIHARHATALAEAGFLQRLALRWSIAMEFRAERRWLEPSLHVLY